MKKPVDYLHKPFGSRRNHWVDAKICDLNYRIAVEAKTMTTFEDLKQRYGFAPGSGYVETNIPSVRFFWSTEPVERAPLIYKAGLVLILQGHKTGWLGGREFHYDPEHYLVLSVPVPFECATAASTDNPLLGLFIDIDISEMLELSEMVPIDTPPPKPPPTSA